MAPASPVLHSTDDQNTSLIYAVLPPLIKNSMPKVPSLRRSLSGYNRALVGHVRALSTDSPRPGSANPPPPYQEPIASLTSVLSDVDFQDTPPTSPRSLPVDSAVYANDNRAAIKWEFARQGQSLLQGSSCLSSNPDFSRQLYIDAVSYLLRGLPYNLSSEETIRLQAAMPSEMIPPPQQQQQPVDRIITRSQSHDNQVAQQEQDPTILHRVVAMLVLQIFLLFSFLWPYVQTTCRGAYQYERQHHISEKLLNQSWTTANLLTKNTMTVARTVCGWNDGQVGVALEDMVFWWVHGFTGGLRDGVKDGMEVFGLKAVDHRGKRPARA
ncbi:hypothetical protein E4T48_07265 [Aureobasidium sp. EXF-10727]|nr:hypothetical protein E4T48_07265 [Aureobasidium sp. EXF-10727]